VSTPSKRTDLFVAVLAGAVALILLVVASSIYASFLETSSVCVLSGRA